MPDTRVAKLAKVLVSYSLDLQPGEELFLDAQPLAQDLSLAVYKEAILAGAHVYTQSDLPGSQEVYYKYASDEQLEYISPIRRLVVETFPAILYIDGTYNSRELSGVNPERQRVRRRARAELSKISMQRTADDSLKWCYTVFPTHASAQDADMSLSEYEDFVFGAGMLDLEDPVTVWREEAARQQEIIDRLTGKTTMTFKGENIDLRMSIEGRPFLGAAGKLNFPDGEVYTSPVESSVNGWVRFAYPAIYAGTEVIDIELWFEDGKVVQEKASKGEDLLTSLLNTDKGARYLGELGIGTNYNIKKFTKNMLFDEKIGGTIHLAVGAGFPEVGGVNESGLHWDMLCNMSDSEINVDGELFYKDGKFVD